jgi:hypothetical protein
VVNSKKLAWAKRQEEVLDLRRQIADRDRTIRLYAAKYQDLSERYQSAPDADGIGGRPAMAVLRDKNFTYFVDLVNRLPAYPWQHPPENPSAIIGFKAAVQLAREHLIVAVGALWVAPVDNPRKVQLKHDLIRWVSDAELLGLMMRDDFQGRAERSRLIRTAGQLAFGFSAPFVFRSSQEVMVEPVQAERKAQSA